MKKNVLFVTTALWIGGIETALINLLNYFNYEKYDVTLLVLHAELDMLERINSNCRVLIADRDKTYTFDEPYKYNYLYHLTEKTNSPSYFHKAMMWSVPAIKWIENQLYIRYVRNLLRDEHFDVAIIYSDKVAEITIKAINADKYLMFYHHGTMRHVYHDKIAYKKCDKIIAVSDNLANNLKKFVPEAKKKIISIHNLTDVEGIRKKALFPTEELFDSRKFNIVTVGRVSYEKGMDIAVQVCEKLVFAGYKDVRWWIVGGGPAIQDVQQKVIETHMEEYVKLVGMKQNPYPYIRQADLYVQPSRVESFGLTIMEALILGKSVVSTNTIGATELINDGKNGVLCNINIKELAEKIQNLIENRGISDRLCDPLAGQKYEKANLELLKKIEEIL